MSEISEVIASEIADFFAGFGGPGEPDIHSGEAQRLLTERLLSVLALRERAEPVGFVGRHKETGKFASWLYQEAPWLTDDKYEVLSAYITPPAPVVAGWIACSERMPEREYVLAADFSGAYYLPSLPNTQVGIYADWFEDGKPSWDDGDGNDLHLKQVTHWMPLPEAPGKEE
ncbi:DUF551 domain-containing protein [Cronobacter sakazakii]